MRNRQLMLRTLLAAGVTFALAGPATAAGMGGVSVAGIGLGSVSGVSGAMGAASGALGSASGALSGAGLTSGASGLTGGHSAIGSHDGPAGLSATSGHSPFGHAQASSAWASLPALDNDVPGLAVPAPPGLPSAPGLPGLSKSGAPAVPGVDVQAKVDVAGTSKSVDVNTSSLGHGTPKLPAAPALPEGAPKNSTASHIAKSAEKTASSLGNGKSPALPSPSTNIGKTLNSETLTATVVGGLAQEETQSYVDNTVVPIVSNATSPSASGKGKAVKQATNQVPSPSQEQQNLAGTVDLPNYFGKR